MAKLLLSKEVNAKLNTEIEEKVSRMKSRNIFPTLAIVRVGDNPDDISYENSAAKRCEKLGVRTKLVTYSIDVTEEELIKGIRELNDDKEVHGVLVLKPLPKHIDETKVCETLSIEKDIDGITSASAAMLYKGDAGAHAPCTASAVIKILEHYGVALEGKRAVVIGRSEVIGKPVAMMLLKKNATVTICHSRTKDIEEICRAADVIVAAAGVAKMVDERFVKPGQIVIDVGIHFDEDGNMCGDVDGYTVPEIVDMLTPVPGGVGGVTTSILIESVVELADANN